MSVECPELLGFLGERIRILRKAKGLSQEKLAEMSELHPTYISSIERGKVNASVCVYLNVSKALGVPLSELLDIPLEADEFQVKNEMSSLFGRVRILDRKKRTALFQAIWSLLKGIET